MKLDLILENIRNKYNLGLLEESDSMSEKDLLSGKILINESTMNIRKMLVEGNLMENVKDILEEAWTYTVTDSLLEEASKSKMRKKGQGKGTPGGVNEAMAKKHNKEVSKEVSKPITRRSLNKLSTDIDKTIEHSNKAQKKTGQNTIKKMSPTVNAVKNTKDIYKSSGKNMLTDKTLRKISNERNELTKHSNVLQDQDKRTKANKQKADEKEATKAAKKAAEKQSKALETQGSREMVANEGSKKQSGGALVKSSKELQAEKNKKNYKKIGGAAAAIAGAGALAKSLLDDEGDA